MSLKVDNVSKQFGSHWVLRSISFEAENGSIIGIFGAKGSGKSTLLRVIAGLESADGGTMSVNGEAHPLSPSDKRVGFVPNAPVSSFWQRTLSGNRLDTVDVASRQTEAIHEALEGELQVILLDDPFCFLDVKTKEEFYSELRRKITASESTMIVTSNNIEDLYHLCDKIAIIENGEISQFDEPEVIYEHPKTVGVAQATGRINLFEARRLTSSKADLPEFQTISGEHRLFAQRTKLGSLGAINQNVMLAIRPEHISIAFGASFPEDNLLKASITNVRFLGPTTLIELDSGGLHLSALVLRLVGLKPGDECMVGLPPDRITILKQ